MQITHEEARQLIQSRSDRALSTEQNAILSAHLHGCAECSVYMEEIRQLEGILVSVLKRQWARPPLPLSIDTLLTKPDLKVPIRHLLATRILTIGVFFLAFLFSAWQLTLSNRQIPSGLPATILTVPTPSAQFTRTKSALQDCREMLYQVQANDTLESIASRFSVPREQIVATNNLRTATLQPSMQLTVLICRSTPTVTANPGPETTIYTPTFVSMVSTPGE